MATIRIGTSYFPVGNVRVRINGEEHDIVDVNTAAKSITVSEWPRAKQTPEEMAFWDAHPDGIRLSDLDLSVTFTWKWTVLDLPKHELYVWQKHYRRVLSANEYPN